MMHHSDHMSRCHTVHSCCCSSNEDQVDRLEKHLDGLHKQAKAVEERIADLKKGK
jgi:hypothetical protein